MKTVRYNSASIKIFSFLIFLSTSCTLFSQIQHTNKDKDFRLFDAGIIAGANFSQVDGDNYAGFHKLGFNGGGIAHVNLNAQWSISFELLFSQKGSSTPTDPSVVNTFKLTMNYVEVPLQINYNDQNRLLFGAGIAYGRLFSAKELVNGYEYPVDSFQLEKDELSYVIGGTILIGKQKHLGLNIHYQGSITKVGPAFPYARISGLVNRLIAVRGIYYF